MERLKERSYVFFKFDKEMKMNKKTSMLLTSLLLTTGLMAEQRIDVLDKTGATGEKTDEFTPDWYFQIVITPVVKNPFAGMFK